MQKLYRRDNLSNRSGSLHQGESRSLGWKQDVHLLCQGLRLWQRMQRQRLLPNRSTDSQLEEDYQVQFGLLQDWPVRSSTGQWSWNLNGWRLYAVCMRNCSFHALGFKKDLESFFLSNHNVKRIKKFSSFFYGNGPIKFKVQLGNRWKL